MRIPRIAVLMGTWQGGEFVEQQIESIAAQKDVAVELFISDDGSTDGTLDRLGVLSKQFSHLGMRLRLGPQRGFVANFLSLACDRAIQADYFAFADQDDVWHIDKLAAAIRAVKSNPLDKPLVYFSRTRIVDARGKVIGMSPPFRRAPSLENALVQSIGGGNTAVFNNAARELLCHAGPDIDVPSHDWWLYLAASACGGHVVFDQIPRVDYRQHGGNLVGENSSLLARAARMKMLIHGRFRDWIDRNLQALERLDPLITEESRRLINEFKALRDVPDPLARLDRLRNTNIYRQTKLGNISMFLAASINRL